MGRFLLGIVIGWALLALGVSLYLYLGFAPVATASSPFPFERKIVTMALDARMKKEAPKQPGLPATPENLTAGAHTYRDDCAVCHGLPGQPKTHIAAGMYPPPPQLFHGKGVTDDPVGYTYWKVTNGIRLTGMPSFSTLSDAQRWQVSQFLANANQLPAAATQVLTAPAAAPGTDH